MECWTSQSGLSEYLDGGGTHQQRREMQRHLDICPMCAERADDRVRTRLRGLPARKAPAGLETKLRVVASRESLRMRKRLDWAHRVQEWRESVHLSMNNMMRPLALPVAGGLLSTLLLFGILMPDLFREARPVNNDIEMSLFTAASVKDISPIGMADTDITVDLTVDENGRMLEYKVVSGENLLRDESLRRRLITNLMYGQFNPATQFGQAVPGKLRVTFRSSIIHIQG